MSVELVTGHANEKHVSARDAAALHASIISPSDQVLEGGQQFKATIVDANTITIGTGELVMQGHHVTSVEPTTLRLASGTAGTKRNDLVVCSYRMDGMGVETATLRIIQGTSVPSSQTATDPPYATGDITQGATARDFPLYRIPIDGITPATPVKQWGDTLPSIRTFFASFWFHINDIKNKLIPNLRADMTAADTKINKNIDYWADQIRRLWSYSNDINDRGYAETSERKKADNQLSANLTKEIKDRTTADDTIKAQLTYQHNQDIQILDRRLNQLDSRVAELERR